MRSDAVYASEACSKRYRRAQAANAAQRTHSPDKARTRRRPRTNWRKRYLGKAGLDGPMHVAH